MPMRSILFLPSFSSISANRSLACSSKSLLIVVSGLLPSTGESTRTKGIPLSFPFWISSLLMTPCVIMPSAFFKRPVLMTSTISSVEILIGPFQSQCTSSSVQASCIPSLAFCHSVCVDKGVANRKYCEDFFSSFGSAALHPPLSTRHRHTIPHSLFFLILIPALMESFYHITDKLKTREK